MLYAGFALVSLLTFYIYFLGVSHVVFGGDSGDIILSYFFAGVPHPPGYPLNTFLGFIITRLISFGSFAYKANLVSVIYMSFAIGLFGFFLYKLGKNFILAVLGALTLGFVPLFWLYAHIAEVFQLTILLICISLIFLFDFWASKEKTRRKSLYISVLFFGLVVFHHQTTLLLAPAYIFAFLKMRIFGVKNIKETLKLFLFFCAGIIPYIYVFWAARRKTPINWDDPSDFGGFWQLITRADYGTFTAAPDLIGFSSVARLVQVLWYFKVVASDFAVFGVVLILAGLFWLFIKNRGYFWFFLLAAFFSGPFFLAYASFPPFSTILLGISERFLLLNYLFLAVFMFFGMVFVFESFLVLLNRFFGRRTRSLKLLAAAAFFVFPFFLALTNWVKVDLSNSKAGDAFGRDILLGAEPAGIIFLQGDTVTFNTQYSYYVDRVNTDSIIVMSGRLRHLSYREQLKHFYPILSFPNNFFNESDVSYADIVVGLMESNYSSFAIYSFSALDVPDKYVWVQQGMLKRLYLREDLPTDEAISQKTILSTDRLIFRKNLFEGRYLNFFEENIKTTYGGIFADNAFEILRRGATYESKPYFELAIELAPESEYAKFGLGVFYYETHDCQNAKSLFEEIVAVNETYWQAWEGLGQVYKDCFKDEVKSKEFFERSKRERQGALSEPVQNL